MHLRSVLWKEYLYLNLFLEKAITSINQKLKPCVEGALEDVVR